ncbi:uncharacterized protein [Paramisgurnus dabryanus]|uniref:uncharacterized protein n=1 Tax=Paramisgurnus dabryanus TaxID=90735 RepID=UPI003CCF20A0
MGKCKFADSWLENDEFKPWLKPVAENNREAYCTYCKKKISVASMGINAIKSHMHGASHKAAFGRREQSQLSIASFCAPTATPLPNTTAELVKTATTATSPPSSADIRVAMGSTSTMRAEVIWCLNTAANHHSLNSNEGISDIFKSMFPDSDIAKTFTCGKDKTGYIMRFGLAPFFKQQLVDTINKAGSFVLMFDESLNQSTKKKQLDVHVRFWDDDCVQSRYLGSQFLGHGTAQDLLHHIKECVAKLNMRQLISISMDGPNVNLKLGDLLQKEHAELYGAQLVKVGSCGLHTVHNAVKAGFNMWQLDKLLRALHFLFHNVPARREDFTALTGSTCFPLPFCGHRWVENLPVAERAVQVWPVIMKYVDAVKQKKLPNPGTASYDIIEAAQADPLIIAKLQFFLAISRTFNPFLTKYQTDEPVLPFLAKDLSELLKSLLRRFWKRELLHDLTPLQLTKVNVSDEANWVPVMNTDIGLGAESAIKALQTEPGGRIGELSVLIFRRECRQGLVTMVKKLQEKSPLKFPVVRAIACLDPTNMHRDPEWCLTKMKTIVQKFLQDSQLAGGISAGDVIVQQFESFLTVEARDERFLSFQPLQQRIDVFLHSALSKSYPELSKFCQSLLILSHGQATVERGFSVNKQVETCNILEESMEALRLICDKISACGGALKVPLTKELLASVASARSKYRIHLEQERKKKETTRQSLKRKEAEDELEVLKKKRKVLREVCDTLQKDADQLAEQAEGKSGSLMAQLITKSNTLRRRHKEKLIDLEQTQKFIESKSDELRHMSGV